MATSTAFTSDEYFDILEKSEIKLEYRAGEIYTMWGEPLEYRASTTKKTRASESELVK